MELLLAILLGGGFGFALLYSGASNSKNLKSMLSLTDLTIMKVILFAIGFSSLLLALASFMGIFDISHLSIKTTHLGVVLGGLIFGIGFGRAGSCPGTCVADASTGGFKKTLSIIIGGLVGALAFSLSYGFLIDLGLFDAMNLGKLTLFNISDKFPSVFNLGFSGLLILGVVSMAVAMLLPTNPLEKQYN